MRRNLPVRENHGLSAHQGRRRRRAEEDTRSACDDFPKEHWKHLRTTNVVESPFAAVRMRADAAKRFKKTENATAMIWRLLLVVEKRFRKIDAPRLAAEVYRGVAFVDGVKLMKSSQRAAA